MSPLETQRTLLCVITPKCCAPLHQNVVLFEQVLIYEPSANSLLFFSKHTCPHHIYSVFSV